MKIGVLTYHKERSHGATFQAYATYRALKELGCDVEVVDLEHHNYVTAQWLRALSKVYFGLSDYRQERFRRTYYPPMSMHYKSWEELKANPPKVDALCVGSDQTWNQDIATKENMMAYFLDFGNENIPRFSYASSFGKSDWHIIDEATTKRVGELLHNYVGLSVREVTAQKILKDKFDLDATLVCDPTLLHTNYDEFTKGLKQNNEVICYSLSEEPEPFLSASKDISKYIGAPLRWLHKPYYVKGVKNTYLTDFYRWFRYMAGAKYILTNSFHGTVLSIICKKQFAVLYKENGLSSRIVDLLRQVGLEDRIYFSYEEFAKSDVWKQQIDYNEVDRKLAAYREKSWEYLRGVVDAIKKGRCE